MFNFAFNVTVSYLTIAYLPRDLEIRLPSFAITIRYEPRLENQTAYWQGRYRDFHPKAEAMLPKEQAKSQPKIIYKETLADLKAAGCYRKRRLQLAPLH